MHAPLLADTRPVPVMGRLVTCVCSTRSTAAPSPRSCRSGLQVLPRSGRQRICRQFFWPQTLAGRQAATAGVSATADVVTLFADIQREYVRIMSVLRLVLQELKHNGAPHEQVTALDRIINNEVAVVVDTVENEAGEKKVLAFF